MPNGKPDRWFTFMLALIIVLLGGIGTMTLVLNSQTWSKLDRMTALFLHERDQIRVAIDKVCDKQNNLSERLRAVEVKHNGTGHSTGNNIGNK